MSKKILELERVCIDFPTRHGNLRSVDHVSFGIEKGEVLGVVGESGAGKSMTGMGVLGLVEPPGHVSSGKIVFDGKEIQNYTEKDLLKVRGKGIGAIFQDPLTSLNPLFTVGEQLVETLMQHHPYSKKEAQEEALRLLKEVGIPAPEKRLEAYPHEFSGGMRQRIVITLALAGKPKLVIADEPTTALDVSIQMQILQLLNKLKKEYGMAIMLITHDMGVIAYAADRVAVMYAGRLVEIGPVREVMDNPKHPYTKALMGAVPRVGNRVEKLIQLEGSMPRLDQIPEGCAFNPRCPKVMVDCKKARPEMSAVGRRHEVACFLHETSHP